MAPHGENFCMEVRGDPYEKGLFWGIWGVRPPPWRFASDGTATHSNRTSLSADIELFSFRTLVPLSRLLSELV